MKNVVSRVGSKTRRQQTVVFFDRQRQRTVGRHTERFQIRLEDTRYRRIRFLEKRKRWRPRQRTDYWRRSSYRERVLVLYLYFATRIFLPTLLPDRNTNAFITFDLHFVDDFVMHRVLTTTLKAKKVHKNFNSKRDIFRIRYCSYVIQFKYDLQYWI